MTLILFQCNAVLFSIQIIVVNDNSLNMVARYTCFTCTAGIEVCCFLGIIKITMVSNYTWKTEARTNINLSTLALLSFLFYFSSTLKTGILSLININYESHNLASCLARHGVGSRTPYPACSCTTDTQRQQQQQPMYRCALLLFG